MEDKELLAAWEKIGEIYGPQKRTFDEFKFQMQSNDYRKDTFKKLGSNAKTVWGYDNFEQFNADKFLPAPALNINNIPEGADNLPRFNAASSTFVDQSTDVARNSSNPKLSGGSGPGGNSRRISPRTQAIIDSNKAKKEEAKKQVALERAKIAAATTSDLVTQNADFYDVLRNYSSASGNDLFASQLDYNDNKLTGVEKGDFEQKAINFLSEDMFAVVEDTENSQVWKEHGEEYGFLINQLNSQGKEIKTLQNQLAVEKDPTKKQYLIDEINDIMSEGADYQSNRPTETGVSNKTYKFGSYEDMQERFGKLNSLPEFKNYQRAINILGKVRDVSENFDTRNPEWVENQKNLKDAQAYVDIKDKYDIPDVPIPGQYQPKWFKDNISKPIVSSLAKGVNDILSLPRTLSFNDEYGWTDALAEASERIFSKEKNPNMVRELGQSSNKDRGLSERVAMVDDYQLVVDDNIGAEFRSAKTVRDKDGYLVQDNEIVKQVIEKYEANPEEYKSEQQYNLEGALPKFVGVMADLGVLMFGTKGLGTGVKLTGALAKGKGLTRAGNYLSKSTVANRIGLTGAVTGQTHNQLYGEAIRQGMTPTEASAFAVTGSLAVAAVAQINPQFYLIGEKKAASKLTERYIAYLAQGGKESKSTAFKYAMKEVFGAGKREMLEELAEIPALNAVRGTFNQVMSPEKSFEIEWSRGEIEESAIFGLAAGTATGPMNITTQSGLQQQATYAAYKAKDKFFGRLDDLVGKQYIDPEDGNTYYYTKEQADYKKTQFSNLFKQLDAAKLSTGKLSEESETKLLSLFQNANNIQRLMDQAEKNPALLAVLQAQYSLTNDAIAKELQDNKKSKPKTKQEPKNPPVDGNGTTPVSTEQAVSTDNEIDAALNNDPDNVLDGRENVIPEVNENTTEEEVDNIANEAVKEGQKQQAINTGANVEGDQNLETENNSETEVEPEPEYERNEQGRIIVGEGGIKGLQKKRGKVKPKDPKRPLKEEIKERVKIASNGTINTVTGIEHSSYGYPWFNSILRQVADINTDEEVKEYYIQSIENGVKVSENNKDYYSREFKRLGIDPKLWSELVVKKDSKSKPKPLFTKDEVTTAKANNDYLSPLIKRLKENFPGVEIVVDAKAVEELALSQNVTPEGAKAARGVYDAVNNRVLINPKTANKDTPIHEFGHVWTRLAKEERKELWDKGMSLIAGSDLVKNLRAQIAKNPDLQKVYTEDKILDEALAIAIGQRGAKIFESQEEQGIWDNWIKEFFDFIKQKFGVNTNQGIEDLTLREFIEIASTEILTGEKIVPVRSKLKTLNSNIEVRYNKEGDLEIINTKTGKPVSKPTRRKVEKQIIEMNELPAEWIDAGTTLYEALQEDKTNREGFYDPVEAAFIGYKVKRQSFIDNSDVNNINNTLGRAWFSNSEGQALDVIAMEIEGMVYGGEYNASQPRVEVQDLVDIMLKNPGNYLAVPQDVKDAKDNFMEVTGMYPTLKNAEAIKDKITDSNSKLDEVYDEDFLDQDIQNDDGEIPFQLSFQANFKDPITGLTYSYDKNGNKFKVLEDSGYVTKNKTLRDFADKHMVLHTPDFAFSGQISKDGELIVEGKGGMYYPIKFHEKGFFWASTESGADSLVKTLNESLQKNPDGKIYMGLVTATPSKLLSSTTASNAVVDIFTTDSFIKGLGLKKAQVNNALVEAANETETKKTKKLDKNNKPIIVNGKNVMIDKVTGLRANTKKRFSVENNLKLIRTKLANDKSSFEDRKFFVQSFLNLLASNVNPKALDAKGKMKYVKSDKITKTNEQIFKFFKETIGYEQMTGTGGRISKANLTSAVSYMLGEPLLRSESETNKVYAVLEISGKLDTFESDAHESYPKAIGVDTKTNDARTKLHILKDRNDWRDNFADPDTDTNIEIGRPRNKDGKPRSHIQILPTTVGLTYAPVRVLNESENPGMSFQLEGDTNKKQVSESIQRLKDQGNFTEQQLVEYFNRRFPDISIKELGEMYNGKVPEDSPRSEKRKYTSRLEQVLSQETFEEISEEAKTYIPKRNSITEAEAQFMFDNIGLEESINIIKSNPDWLLPEVRIALTNKVVKGLEAEASKLRAEGKVAEANVISTSINGIVEMMAKEGTKAGRFIQAFKLLDALSVDRTIGLINKKLKEAGKDPLTKEQEAEVRRLKEESDNASEGLPKSTALANQYKYTASLVGTDFKSLFEAYFYASILSGTTTQIRNIMANVMSIGNELLVTSIREAFLGNPAAIFHATEGLIKGLSKGWLNAKHILETGVKSDRSDKFDSPVLLEWWRFNTNSKVLNKLLNSKLLPWSPNFLKYVQRAMVAGDQMFFHSAKEMQSRALANRLKKGKDVTPEDIKRAESILNPSKEAQEKAKAEARDDGYKDGTTQFKIRVHEIMEGNRDMTIQGTSEEFAAKTTFNYEPEGALSYLYNFIVQSRQMKGVGPIMTTFIPFARVLTNVFNRFLHYTPVGYVTAARGKVRVASGKTRILSKEEKADLYIKATIGLSTLTGLVGYLMSHADDDDNVLKISAAGPKDFNKKYELQKAGWKPFTVTVGDLSFSYADHPLYFILAAAGTLYESDKYGNSIEGEGAADLFSYVALTTSMSMLQQSWLQGLSDLGRILNSNDPAKAVANKVFGVASSIALPNFHKQLVRQSMEIMGDPIKARRTGTLTGALDQLYRDIPLANSGLYDMVDNYGDPVIPHQGQKFMPLDIKLGDNGDPLTKHLVGEGVFVGSASNRKIEDFDLGESRYLDGDEYQVYKMESAKEVGKVLRENRDYLYGLKGEELGEAVRALKIEARNTALYELFYYGKYKKLTKKKR